MTIDTVLTLARLKELRALTRVRRAIAASAFDPDWAYVLAAIDASLQALREQLAREDPQMVRDCEALLDTEPLTAPAEPLPDLPKGARVH